MSSLAQLASAHQPSSIAARLLDVTHDMLGQGQTVPAMEMLCFGLGAVRAASRPGEWAAFVRGQCRSHRLLGAIHQAPIARRAFEKPRGYAGDAETLDLIYGVTTAPVPESADALRRWEWQSTASQSVRERCAWIAELVDGVARERPGARVLSVACGHLREAERSEALAEGTLREWVALDQDVASLDVVRREHEGSAVRPRPGSVRDLIGMAHTDAPFDLIYSAGLYDYLDERVATRLTAALFSRLASGGRLVIANFTPSLRDIAYMEAFLDWYLIYRDEADMRRLVPPAAVRVRTSRDRQGNVVYLEMERA